MANTIKCKNCGAEIEVSEALRHQIQEEVLSAVQKKHEEEMVELKKSLEDERVKIRQEVEKEVSKEQSIELADLKKQQTLVRNHKRENRKNAGYGSRLLY